MATVGEFVSRVIRQTNKEYAEDNNSFGKACVIANAKVTTRQASKFRRGRGIAWKVINGAFNPLRKGMPGYEEY